MIDLQFASKEACRQMSNPRVSGVDRMKRIARYLLKYPKLVWKYDRGKTDEHVIDVFSHSDWAACRRSRRSTNGGVIVIDSGTVKHWAAHRRPLHCRLVKQSTTLLSTRPRKDWQWWRLGETCDTSSACASWSTAPRPRRSLTKAMSMVEMKEKIESIGGFFSVAETSRSHENVGAIVKKLRWADMSDDD